MDATKQNPGSPEMATVRKSNNGQGSHMRQDGQGSFVYANHAARILEAPSNPSRSVVIASSAVNEKIGEVGGEMTPS
jgi:hypothetical protein